jgi:TPR repeat protein
MPMTRLLCGRLAALAGLALVCGAAPACTPTVEIRATQTCEGGNIEDCKNRCGSNQGMACYKLGWLHEEGQVVDHDFPRAKKLYEQACDANWAVACRALGDLYWKGDKVEQNQKKAIEYWSKACGLGLGAACPTQTEVDVADGRLVMTIKSNGSVQVTPNPKAAPKAPPAEPAPQPQ